MSSLHQRLAFAALLLLQINFTLAQYQHVWAEEQPTQTYTVYNGKVYVHPKEKGFWSNLFDFDLANNSVVRTVLGWSDYFYNPGPPLFNDTLEELTDPISGTGSQNYPQLSPGAQSFHLQPQQQQQQKVSQSQFSQQGPGYNKNILPSTTDEKFPKQPRYPPHPYYNQYKQQPQQYAQQQQPPRPSQYSSQQYPQVSSAGQPGMPGQTVNIYSYPYGNPNAEVIKSMENLEGNLDSIISHTTNNNQERNYRSGVPENLEPPQAQEKSDEVVMLPNTQQSQRGNNNKQSIRAEPKADDSNVLAEDHYPCPAVGQWKWDGEVCIAIGPAPTWACRPNDLVSSGRIAICRNKIYFPNQNLPQQDE